MEVVRGRLQIHVASGFQWLTLMSFQILFFLFFIGITFYLCLNSNFYRSSFRSHNFAHSRNNNKKKWKGIYDNDDDRLKTKYQKNKKVISIKFKNSIHKYFRFKSFSDCLLALWLPIGHAVHLFFSSYINTQVEWYMPRIWRSLFPHFIYN